MPNFQNFHDHPGFENALMALLTTMTKVDADAVDAMYETLVPEGGTRDDIDEIAAGAAAIIQAAELLALGMLVAERWIDRRKSRHVHTAECYEPDEFQPVRDHAPFN